MTDEREQDTPEQPADDEARIRSYKDRFFQGYFGITEVARGFLPAVVPRAFDTRVDWRQMELVRGAIVDDQLDLTASDLLWRIGRRDRGDAFALVLWEHQSRPDKWIALWLLRHIVRIWTRTLQDDSRSPKGNLPLILLRRAVPRRRAVEYDAAAAGNRRPGGVGRRC